ncbi:hypothetical protein BC828DRAFT_392868 [Blastocladiella britannica]|nr:hypothetical protein BC828DRAFT_392868 [Blastocladiella britannica]
MAPPTPAVPLSWYNRDTITVDNEDDDQEEDALASSLASWATSPMVIHSPPPRSPSTRVVLPSSFGSLPTSPSSPKLPPSLSSSPSSHLTPPPRPSRPPSSIVLPSSSSPSSSLPSSSSLSSSYPLSSPPPQLPPMPQLPPVMVASTARASGVPSTLMSDFPMDDDDDEEPLPPVPSPGRFLDPTLAAFRTGMGQYRREVQGKDRADDDDNDDDASVMANPRMSAMPGRNSVMESPSSPPTPAAAAIE